MLCSPGGRCGVKSSSFPWYPSSCFSVFIVSFVGVFPGVIVM